MVELFPTTRTLAVLCAFSRYDIPTREARRQLPALERVEPTLNRLHVLLSSDRFSAAGVQVVELLNLSKTELLEQLDLVRDAVEARSNVNMVVFWSGHGNVQEQALRLALRNSWDPIRFDDGIGLDEVLRYSGVARVSTWTLFLDACYAGEGLSDVMNGAHGRLKSESGTLRGYGALCSSAPFEKSRDSVFLDTVVAVLERGPSEAVRVYAESEGGGGSFNPFNKLLSLGELFEAVSNEYAADPTKYRRAEPWRIKGGMVDPRLFPNPQFHEQQPSRLVESAFRPFARAADLESHFFPKALGIDNLEFGWHFSGRVEVSRSILAWMARSAEQPKDRLYVLAADGGTGKSALLGRLIALSDPTYRLKAKALGWNEARDQQTGTLPAPDRMDAALSLRILTPQTLAEHLASLLGTGSFEHVEGFVAKAVESYRRSDGAAPCIVLDALDEALEPAAIVFRIIRPLQQAGWKLLVATRRTAKAKGAQDLIADLGPATVFELDQDQNSWQDIYSYAQDRLARHAVLSPLADTAARLIADRADSKFLFARMATSSLLRSPDGVNLEALPSRVAENASDALRQEFDALDQEFQHSFGRRDEGATAMLAALAWSEGDGVPVRDGIWAAMAEAVGSLRDASPRYEERHLIWLLREAGRFIQEAGDGEQAVYRLFHKSLVDHFQQGSLFPSRAEMDAVDDRVAAVLVGCVRATGGWAHSNHYLIRHLPAHLSMRPGQAWLNKLLLNFEWVQARLNLSGIQALLGDYRLCEAAYPATARLHRTLSMVAHILGEHPDQLIPQMLGRIAPGVPDITPLLKGEPGANFDLPPPTQQGLDESRRLVLPGLNVEQRGANLIDQTLSLDGFLARAIVNIDKPIWAPLLGGLSQAGALVYRWLVDGAVRTNVKMSDSVTSVALSADLRTVVSGNGDHTLRMWDALTGQPLRILSGHDHWVTSVAVSKDGFTLVSASVDCTVRLWNVRTGMHLRTLQGHEDAVNSVALSADGRVVASASRDGTVRLWAADTGEPLQTLSGHEGTVNSVAISINSNTLVSGGTDGAVRIWDCQSGQLLRTIQGPAVAVNSVALSNDGRTLVSGGDDSNVYMWDAQTGRPLRIFRGHEAAVECVALSTDGKVIASGSRDHAVRIWSTETGSLIRVLQGHEYHVTGVALSDDGYTVVSGSSDSTVRLWDARAHTPEAPDGHTAAITCLALSAKAGVLVSGSDDSSLRLWDAQTGRHIRTMQGHDGAIQGVALSADGQNVVSGGRDETVRIWDAQTGELLHILEGGRGSVNGVAMSIDGRTVVSCSDDGTVCMWDAQTGRLLRTLEGHLDSVNRVALSSDGTFVVSCCDAGTVRIWDALTGQIQTTLEVPGNAPIRVVSLSSDSKTLIIGSNDRNLYLWDMQDRVHLHTLASHDDWINGAVFSADDRVVISCSEREVRMWDTLTGQLQQVLTVDTYTSAVASAELLGKSCLVIASGNTLVRLAHVPASLIRINAAP